MAKKKRVTMRRLHFSLPPWMVDRLQAVAQEDGRTVADLLRRLILRHLRDLDPEGLPNVNRIAAWKRASKSLDGLPKTGKRRKSM